MQSGGQYVCKAVNHAGEATSTSCVSVKGIPPTSDSEAERQKPAFYVPLKNQVFLQRIQQLFHLGFDLEMAFQDLTEGDCLSLECVIVGTPEPEIIWYRNNVPLKESPPGTQLLFHGDTCRLVIRDVKAEPHTGEYKVRK